MAYSRYYRANHLIISFWLAENTFVLIELNPLVFFYPLHHINDGLRELVSLSLSLKTSGNEDKKKIERRLATAHITQDFVQHCNTKVGDLCTGTSSSTCFPPDKLQRERRQESTGNGQKLANQQSHYSDSVRCSCFLVGSHERLGSAVQPSQLRCWRVGPSRGRIELLTNGL